MQAKVVKIAVADGQVVAAGELLLVVEAMKMEQSLTAAQAGEVRDLSVAVGDSVTPGQPLCRIVEVTKP